MAIGLILTLALGLRLVYIPVSLRCDPYLVEDSLFGDAKDYDAIGWNLCQGNGFAQAVGVPTSSRAPAYPAFLALAYWIGGHDLQAVRILQALLGTGIVLWVFRIACRFYGPECAYIAALIMAFHPIAIYFGAWLITETLFVFILYATFLLAISARTRPTVVHLFGLGILLALMALTRPQSILYWAILPVWVLCVNRADPFRKAVGQWLLVALVSLLTVLPWTVRNYLVHEAFVLVDTHGGWTLYGSYGPTNQGEFVSRYALAARGLSEYQRDRLYYHLTMQWIGEHPLEAIRLIPQKVGRLFSPMAAVDVDYSVPWSVAAKILYGLFLLLAAIGMLQALSQWRASLLLYSSILLTVSTSAIFYGCTRFSLPMQPSVVIFCSLPIARLLSRAADAARSLRHKSGNAHRFGRLRP